MRTESKLAVLAAGAVTAALLTGCSVTATEPSAPQVGARPLTQPAAQPTAARPATLEVHVGDSVYTAAGRRIRVPVEKGASLRRAERAAGGWVVESSRESGDSAVLWYVPVTGQARRLATRSEGWAVAHGGGAVFVSDLRSVRRLALPNGRVTARIGITGAMEATRPFEALPNFALLHGGTGGEGPAPTAVWDVGRQRIVTVKTPFHVRQQLPDGRLLVGVAKDFSNPLDECLAVTPLRPDMAPKRTGMCVPSITGAAQASADGRLLALERATHGDSVYEIHRFPDALAGRPSLLRTLPVKEDVLIGWETADAVLTRTFTHSWELVITRCRVGAAVCERAPLPPGVPAVGAVPVD